MKRPLSADEPMHEITPEPTPEEREALLVALAHMQEGEESSVQAQESAWWRCGVRENLGEGDELDVS